MKRDIKTKMPKIAWARKLYNAYNNVKKGDTVYDKNNNVIGTADGYFARCTDTSPGAVCLKNDTEFIWVSGDVEKKSDKSWIFQGKY